MKMDFAMLRNMQGMHAPLKLQMEFQTAKQVSCSVQVKEQVLIFDFLRALVKIRKSTKSKTTVLKATIISALPMNAALLFLPCPSICPSSFVDTLSLYHLVSSKFQHFVC